MKKVAIFMSDFHLGQNDQLEEFFADEEFVELIGRLSRHHRDDDVDLVLLGDVIDLWTTSLDPAEQHAETAKEITLRFPARTPQELAEAVRAEKAKTQAIVNAHPRFFEALGHFLADAPDKRKLIYVPGNHDHSMVCPDLQDVIRKSIVTAKVAQALPPGTDLGARITFQNFYQDRDLQVYAEHGNQFTYGGTFKYDAFEKFGEECPGYFQFKLVSNRLERKNPQLDSVFMQIFEPAMWPGIILWLLLKWKLRLFWAMRDFQTQYRHDDRPGPREARARLVPAWKTVGHVLRANFFGFSRDEFGAALPRLFDKSQTSVLPLSGEHLDALTTKTIILGHSHHRREIPLAGLEGVTYYNTGGWIMRYENGRQVVEQTWVTLSLDKGDGGPAGRRVVLDREMVNRHVQKAKRSQSPVTTDGRQLNPTLRKMTDLRVGDVVLFRGNYAATIRRLLKEWRFGELIAAVPDMVAGMLNRKGTNSPWNHVALVYASPSEQEEADSYNDPLFLESVPGTGVGIHGPQHYLEHPTDWDLAVLRLKAGWLADVQDGWKHRRLLRRMALSALQVHYDTHKIRGQTWREAARSMDQRGKSIVGGLAKGALGGFLAAASLLAYRAGYEYFASPDLDRGWMLRARDWCIAFRHWAINLVDDSNIVPYLKWSDIENILISTTDPLFQALSIVSYAATTVYVFAGLAGTVAVLCAIWFLSSMLYGAGLGALIVPPLAELSRGWSDRSAFTRWFVTVIWILFYICLPFAVLAITLRWISEDQARMYKLGGAQLDSALWFYLVIFLAVWLLGTALIILVTPAFAIAVDWCTRQANRLVVAPWRGAVRRLFGRKRQSREDETVTVAPQFVCSTLVQYALAQTAMHVAQAGVPGAKGDVDSTPVWKDYLPKHFSASDKFDWIYVLTEGKLIYRPSPSVRVQASPQMADPDKPRELSGFAWVASMLGALSGSLIFAGFVFSQIQCKGKLWGCHALTSVYVIMGAGIGLAFVALACAKEANRRMALRPYELQGRVLSNWASIFAILALVGSLVVVFHGRFFFD